MFSDLYDLQRQGLVVDTRLVVDDGEVAIHLPLLKLWCLSGGLSWAKQDLTMSFWSQEFLCLEAQQFLDVLYRRHETLNISNKHYTVIEDTDVTDDILNNNSECDDDVKLEAYEIYDQVWCEDCGKVFNNKQNLYF